MQKPDFNLRFRLKESRVHGASSKLLWYYAKLACGG